MSQLAEIGIDIDGVLHDFAASFHNYLLHIEQPGVPKEIDSLEVNYDFFTDWGIDAEGYEDIHDEALQSGFLYNGPVVDQAVSHVNRLSEAGHKIHIITMRPQEAVLATGRWLVEHDFEFDTLTFSADKTVIRTDAFVEDNPFNYFDLEEAGCNPFLINRGWNRGAPGMFRRVDSVGDFVDHVIGRTGEEINEERRRWFDKSEMIDHNVWY